MTDAAPVAAASPDALAAAHLRRHHEITTGTPEPAPVWRQAGEIRGWLDGARACCDDAPPEASKAIEWLMDNEYHLRRAVRQVQEDMPPAFYASLPRLAAAEGGGLPRILAAARGYLATCHGQPDLASANRFMAAYQQEGALTLAELWACPAMLRLVCLETIVLAMSRLLPRLQPPFAPCADAPPDGVEDPTEAVSRAVVALSAISRIPWKDFVETSSHVEAVLRGARDGLHAGMDFDTRDSYRRVVEALARGSDRTETDIAMEAVRRADAHGDRPRRAHPGWWLVGDGRAELERAIGYRAPFVASLRRRALDHPGAVYALLLGIFTAAALVPPVAILADQAPGALVFWLAIPLLILPASIISVSLTNWLVALAVPPRVLPKMDFRDGLPEGETAAVIVPVIPGSAAEVPALLSRLERHWLTNADPRVRFAVLSDPVDADSETAPADADVVAALTDGIARLNDRHRDHRPFVLMQRRRRWNAAEGVWMGWERKRGKIEEFNAFLVTGVADAFPVTEGDVDALREARYVVTLDADTVPPPGSIHRLFGALAHPLNRPVLNRAGNRVIAGYTFIQPRIEIAPEAGAASIFTRLYTGDTAIDIYSRAVSDVYQDLFGEGIFIGKGAYDPDSFFRALEGRVPENALVSHDLIEGLHGRAALASDVVFYENFPSRYLDYARRMHRWVRGDWQLLPWLWPSVPGRETRWTNPLSGPDRWKIVDNLRRSLVPPCLVLLALIAWLGLPQVAPIWTLLVVAAPGSYLISDIVSGVSRGRRRGAVLQWRRQFIDHAGRWGLVVVFMAHEAIVSVDAIARALWRLGVSRRYLLQWQTAAQVEAEGADTRARYWRDMGGAPVLALGIAGILAAFAPAALPGALPLLVLWGASPEIARLIARPARPPAETLAPTDRLFLRRLARQAWAYFETFAGPGDNWLAPDNHQTAPFEETAHRTSPTNIGMQLLSTLTAFDLGHVGAAELSARCAAALASVARLPTYRGHVLNWIDTTTLDSLDPGYVSTVDSGNLAVALVTLGAGLDEAADGPVLSPAAWDGLADTLALLRAALDPLPAGVAGPLDALAARLAADRAAPAGWYRAISRIRDADLRTLADAIGAELDAAPEADPKDVRFWLDRCWHQINAMARDLDALCPWCAALDAVPDAALAARLGETLRPDMSADALDAAAQAANALLDTADAPEDLRAGIAQAIATGLAAQADLRRTLRASGHTARGIADAMDFRFLYDPETKHFFIGFNLGTDRIDEHRYDLLASEARLASYFAIAKGDVPVAHWFHLGRPLSRSAGMLTVLSWNGSMFEYLMPALLIRSAPGQLLWQSEVAAVDIQRRYGDKLGLPWGVSEAAFAARDAEHRYQYQAFGVAGLGLKHGLAKDYVVAPYASALALAVRPQAAVDNLERLAGMGMRGRFGFYDALDFTTLRGEARIAATPVLAYMAHHQGMLLAAIDNALCDDILVRRFNRDPRIAAMDLLLHERVPWEYVPERLPDASAPLALPDHGRAPPLHGWEAEETGLPALHPMGNGRLSAWVTGDAQATLWWHGQAMTGWEPDLRGAGVSGKLFLRDASSGAVWRFDADGDAPADVTFHPEKAAFHILRHEIAASQEITVAAAEDILIRRVTLQNDSGHARTIEVTDAAEIVLSGFGAHERHPAFSKLFIEAATLPDLPGLIFCRRPRRPDERPPVLLHMLMTDEAAVRFAGSQTDRRAFLDRHGDPASPAGLAAPARAVEGATLDPVSALRAEVRLRPGQRAELAFLTIAAGSRDTALETAHRYRSRAVLDWAVEDAARTAALVAHRMKMPHPEVQEAQTLAARLVLPPLKSGGAVDAPLPAMPDLWGLGISGDLPIVLLRVADADLAPLLPVAVRAHRWWHRSGLPSDLVILRTSAAGYEEPIMALLHETLRDAGLADALGGRGGIHLHGIDRIAPAQRTTLEGCARLVLDGAAARLSQALPPDPRPLAPPPLFNPGGVAQPSDLPPLERPGDLLFDNGWGGFSPDGATYRIHLADGRTTPVPWCNVLANDRFGTIVSEAGLGFTWSLNAGEYRLTPWSNDPVTDRQAEALYLRDEETGAVWTTTPLPAGEADACAVTHGAGTTRWVRASHGLNQEMTVCVAPEAGAKIVRLRLRNATDRARRITATYYAEWQLGALASAAHPFVVTDYDPGARAMIARNGWAPEFGARAAFLTSSHPPHSLTADRAAFLGTGDPRHPEGLRRWRLDGQTIAPRDACAAYQVHIDLAPRAADEVVFVLGDAETRAAAIESAPAWAASDRAKTALRETAALWDRRLGGLRVQTPDPAFDLMVNRWLRYQTFASRILARAGFQQAGGGIGFRDQLQDMMAILQVEPARVRAHILDCAAHQFEEGDVLHWWHIPGGRGVRTRCSDDMMWLVYATHRYVTVTGDAGILAAEVPFLSAPELTADEDDRYAAFPRTLATATLFEHCRRAMVRGVTAGAHGLPLIGTGDWNDGMDRVGVHGRGESLWLAWFAAACCDALADLSGHVARDGSAADWRTRAAALRRAAETAGWDGAWYIRALDDDGAPWGSSRNAECSIDSISQSWSVLADAPDRARAATALDAARARLIDRDARLVRLLAPPFDRTPRDPGYIRAYPPGIRENGGQYTHAATWMGLAFARLGQGDAAFEVFDLINPIRRSETPEQAAAYRGEPFVIPADVGGADPFTGRAGWTWYTGAAAWAWRLGVEGILGIDLQDGALRLTPVLPSGWGGYRARLSGPDGTLDIEVRVTAGAEARLDVDGQPTGTDRIGFPGAGKTRRVVAHISPAGHAETQRPGDIPSRG